MARLIGPLLVVIGVGVLLSSTHYARMTENFLKDDRLYYFSGAAAFLIGMAMVLHHNIWSADWRVAIQASTMSNTACARVCSSITGPPEGSREAAETRKPAGARTALSRLAPAEQVREFCGIQRSTVMHFGALVATGARLTC